MAETYAGNSGSYPANAQLPQDGIDDETAASFVPAVKVALDRTANINANTPRVYAYLEDLIAGVAAGGVGILNEYDVTLDPFSYPTGTKKWSALRVEATDSGVNDVCSDGQYVYAHVWGVGVYKLDRRTGSATALATNLGAFPLSSDGAYLYTQNQATGGIDRRNRSTGSVINTITTNLTGINLGRLYADGYMVLATAEDGSSNGTGKFSDNTHLKAVKADLSGVWWSKAFTRTIYAARAAGGMVYAVGMTGTSNAQVYALFASSGNTSWYRSFSTTATDTVRAVDLDGDQLIIGGDTFDGAEVRALNPLTGADIWAYAYGSTVKSVASDGRYIYVGGGDTAQLHILNRQGRLLWKVAVGLSGGSIVSLSTDGESVFVGCNDSGSGAADCVYRFQVPTPPTVWRRVAGSDRYRPRPKLAIPSGW